MLKSSFTQYQPGNSLILPKAYIAKWFVELTVISPPYNGRQCVGQRENTRCHKANRFKDVEELAFLP